MSLQTFQTPHILANTVRLHRQVFSGSFLLVEGNSDRKLFVGLCDAKACAIRECKGKDVLLETLHILEKDNFSGVLAIIDRDYADFLGEEFDNANLLLTPEHDAECMLLRSKATTRVLGELASEAKLAAAKTKFGPVNELIATRAAVVGCLRLVSLREKMDLKFDGMRFSFVNLDDLAIDLAKMVRLVISRTDGCALKDSVLIGMVTDEMQKNHASWHVCVGHDAIELLGLALRRLVGSRASAEVLPDVLERELRLAFRSEDFRATTLHAEIQAWEARNPPYRIVL